MPDLSEYPVQGKLRIREANFEGDIDFIRQHVGSLSQPVLKSLPGYEFLKFWYADFAATDEQWAVLAPEMDKRNILVTLFEAPVFYVQTLAEEEEEKAKKSRGVGRVTWVYNIIAAILLAAALVMPLLSMADGIVSAELVGLAIIIALVGQIHARLRSRRIS